MKDRSPLRHDHTSALWLSSSCFAPTEQEVEELLKPLQQSTFAQLSQQSQFYTLCERLCDWIEAQSLPCFLLPKLSFIIAKINEEAILESPFRLANFEMWLILFAQIDAQQQQRLREKIAGQAFPRESYQLLFPIEEKKLHPGSHTVCAHKAPDLDTSVTSFWGWLDAFGARIGESMHLWNLPGGRLGQVESLIFEQFLGKDYLEHLAKRRESIEPLSIELVSPRAQASTAPLEAFKGTSSAPSGFAPFQLYTKEDRLSKLTLEHYKEALVIVDEEGYYLGQWHRSDMAQALSILSLLTHTFTWIQNEILSRLMKVLAQPNISWDVMEQAIEGIYALKILDAANSAPSQPRRVLQSAFAHLFPFTTPLDENAPQELHPTLEELALACSASSFKEDQPSLKKALGALKRRSHQKLFNPSMTENSPSEEKRLFFAFLEETRAEMQQVFEGLRDWCDRFEVALKIKEKILKSPHHYLSVKAELAEVEQALKHCSSLCAVYPEKSGRLVPVGMISREQLSRRSLASASLRDFSSSEEMEISKRVDVISIVDHHKCSIASHFAPVAHISNTQACATLVAELKKALFQRAKRLEPSSWIAKERLLAQNFTLLLAILDDTDLLKKASTRDLEACARLIEESLALQDFSNAAPFSHSPSRQELLSHPHVRALLEQLDHFKAQVLEEEIRAAATPLVDAECLPTDPLLFRDTKVQNGTARVGQIKLLPAVRPLFFEHREHIRRSWCARAEKLHHFDPHVDLHLQMISTIEDAQGHIGEGQDELWIWCDTSERSLERLTHFLRGFKISSAMEKERQEHPQGLKVHIYGEEEETRGLKNLVYLNFLQEEKALKQHPKQEGEKPHLVITYAVGRVNSRKSLVSPFLP